MTFTGENPAAGAEQKLHNTDRKHSFQMALRPVVEGSTEGAKDRPEL
jgi:hypothetical protein